MLNFTDVKQLGRWLRITIPSLYFRDEGCETDQKNVW
jgi:hypothetical protein